MGEPAAKIDAGEHLGLVHYWVKRFRHDSEERDELVGVATLELVRAAIDYSPDRGEFSTIASQYIKQGLIKHRQYHTARKRDRRRTVHLSDKVASRYGAPPAPSRFEIEDERRDNARRAAACLALVDDRYAKVLRRRAEGATFKEIADEMGVCFQRVQQIQSNGIRRIRKAHGIRGVVGNRSATAVRW